MTNSLKVRFIPLLVIVHLGYMAWGYLSAGHKGGRLRRGWGDYLFEYCNFVDYKYSMAQNIIKFLRNKDYKFIKNIGQGGTGKTVLIEDETIGEKFVCKKYSPYFKEHQDTYYNHFVSEIKLLHLLYHKNIVRVFNYYLYPEKTTGYILMEYINGLTVQDYLKENPERLDDIFIQTVSGFRYLEENEILHRDIRPENILVSNVGVVKVIDFGFGKKIEFDQDHINSVSLNWRYKTPKTLRLKLTIIELKYILLANYLKS